jgi:hypothetical protein
MHDASEAYLSDMSRPVNRMLPAYMDIERGVEKAIADRYSLQYPCPAMVKLIDNRSRATEGENFFRHHQNKWWKNTRIRGSSRSRSCCRGASNTGTRCWPSICSWDASGG